jgi:hypothetical protein
VRPDEFRAPHQVYGWLAKVVRWGNFTRIPEPLYYRLERADSFTNQFVSGPNDRKRLAWPTIFTGLLEAAMPLCATTEERQFFQRNILYRVVANPVFRPGNEIYSSKKLIAECLERLGYEGNTHLFSVDERPPVLAEVERLSKLHQPSRMQRGIYQIGQRSRLAKLIYPKSKMQRIAYQIRYPFDLLGRQVTRMLRY